ncbi:MAG TPA: DUF1080 domain-containing protein [Opitutaceae bacterium]|nr:DUF1080 domain-containing protein [Opitutaceae bacterium]
MKNTPLLLLAVIALALAAPLRAADFTPDPGFTALFNGRDLTGWHLKDGPPLDGKTDAGDGRYAIVDGALSGNDQKAQHGRVLLWTTKALTGNFVLRLEFRAAEKTDGGLFFNKTQLQCGDYSSYAYKSCKAYRPLDWNAIEVTVRDGVARCTCNGELLEAALKIPEPGEIGLEADKGAIAYRRIEFKPLP